eukprot:TRINITY_DN12240_c0_g1_i1.p2 TRINITY_DN12240_c0_g1~~TRINITY_DN12240_c0_g1_i1.p2  ORF type:complete len:58 (-),score=2.54 TRINITY_DN12240_c0_g1_i1:74-247(-)
MGTGVYYVSVKRKRVCLKQFTTKGFCKGSQLSKTFTSLHILAQSHRLLFMGHAVPSY